MRYQPQGLARIDRGNPISRDMRFALNAGSGSQNLVNGKLWAQEPAFAGAVVTPITATPQGKGWSQAGTQVGWKTTSLSPATEAFQNLDQATMMVVCFVSENVGTSDAEDHALFVNGTNVGSSIKVAAYSGQRALSGNWRQANYNAATFPVSGAVLNKGMRAAIITTFQKNGLCEMFLNGTVISSVTAVNEVLSNIEIGTDTAVALSSNALGPCTVSMVIGWGRKLSQAEIASISANPYQLFAAPEEDYESAATNAYTLTAAPGAFTLSGAAASLKASRRLAASPGALSLSGAAAGLTASRRLAAATGSLILTGANASLVAARRLPAAVASFALTGSNASLTVARRLAASAGAFTLTGSAANLTYSPAVVARVLVAQTGSFSLSGGAATLRISRRLRADAGSFAISGNAAGFVRTMVAITVPLSRTVNFDGGINSVNFGGGTNRVDFDGGTNRVNFGGGINKVNF